MDSFLWRDFKNNPVQIPTIEHFPSVLYSQKDLMGLFGVNYKVEFYRKLERYRINKLKIGNLVRYRKEEIAETFLASMYITAFMSLIEKHGDQYIRIIQERALELLKP